MNKFDNKLKVLLQESDVQMPRNTLDVTVFQFFNDGNDPLLLDGIKAQILTDIQELNSTVPIMDFFIIGNILTPYYTEKTPIEVNVEVDPEIMDNLAIAEVLYNLRRINGRLAIGTTHPIYYFLIPGTYDETQADAIYDIANEQWIKRPDPINPNIGIILSKFNETISSVDVSTGMVRRNLIETSELKELGKDNLALLRLHIQQKMDELKENIKHVSKITRHTKALEQLIIDTTLIPAQIISYGKQYSIPEIIIIKLLERYYFIKFIDKIDSILEGGFNIPSIVNNNKMGKYFKRA